MSVLEMRISVAESLFVYKSGTGIIQMWSFLKYRYQTQIYHGTFTHTLRESASLAFVK